MLICVTALLCGCGARANGGDSEGAILDEYTVVFSVANEDPDTAIAVMKITVDGEPLFYGPVAFREPSDYIYLGAHLRRKEVRVWVMSEVDGEILETERIVSVRDHLWIVVTRGRNLDNEAEIRIEMSYENGDVWRRTGLDKQAGKADR
jgi:hypothetical protein